MNVCVVGLWHLGTVTASCLAALGHRVIGLDEDARVISNLCDGRPPLFEPGLQELVTQGVREGRLSFSTDPAVALATAQVVWVTYDTPVDDDDVADFEGVVERVRQLLRHMAPGAVVVISSQLVAGCTRRLQEVSDREYPEKSIEFAYSPENLRLGKAIQVFMEPDRIVIGANSARVRGMLAEILQRFADRILWMTVESAEMTKHALNAFLALSVTFANELASICERVGADAKEVERGLKSEQRIGPGAYVAPGAAFAGGTLARDVQYLKMLAGQHQQLSPLLSAIKESNDHHRGWTQRKLEERFGDLRGRRIAVLGLTYKPGTSTLRRSSSIELCRWLTAQGATVTAHDPNVSPDADDLPGDIAIRPTAAEALVGAEAVVIGTAWPEYRNIEADALITGMARLIVIDAARFVDKNLNRPPVDYVSVGTPSRELGRRQP
jgi:UDPglucose 6-dehydrogenase